MLGGAAAAQAGGSGSSRCEDLNTQCDGWAQRGECVSNADYMLEQCPYSCEACVIWGRGATCSATGGVHPNLTLTDRLYDPSTLPPACYKLYQLAPHGVPAARGVEATESDVAACLGDLAKGDHCVEVHEACVNSNGTHTFVTSATNMTFAESVDQPGIRDDANTFRVPLPGIGHSTHCAELHGANRERLPNATLISPIWPNNFGETLLSTMLPLLAHAPTEQLIVSVPWCTTDELGPCASNFTEYRSFWDELVQLTWPGTTLTATGASDEPKLYSTLSTCQLSANIFSDEGFSKVTPSLLGHLARKRGGLRVPPRSRTPTGQLKVGIIDSHTIECGTIAKDLGKGRDRLGSRGPEKSDESVARAQGALIPVDTELATQEQAQEWATEDIFMRLRALTTPHPPCNMQTLLDQCAVVDGVSCEPIFLDDDGVVQNAEAIAGLHAMIAMHGAHMAYAALAERPFAALEIKPVTMPEPWFNKYYGTAFQTDTMWFTYHATHITGRWNNYPGAQHQSAILPEDVFRTFLCNLTATFANVE